MKFHINLVTIWISLSITPASFSNVVISEVLFNEAGGDIGGEWIELFNNGETEISLKGWSIGDEETEGSSSLTEAMMLFPDNLVIKPGQFLIVAANALTFESTHGFVPDVEVASGTAGDNPNVPNLTIDSAWDLDGGIINLSNSQDQVLLRDDSQIEVDRIAWGPSSSQLDPDAEADGQSWFRRNLFFDTDSSEDWELTPLDQLSTPGSGPIAVIARDLTVQWEVRENNERVLVWNEIPGTLFYEIRSSEDLRDWKSVETVIATSWSPPQSTESAIFYLVIAR